LVARSAKTPEPGGEPAFHGFPSSGRATAIPNVFFTDVLPHLADDAVAAGVALYAFKALLSKRGSPRFVTEEELAGDTSLAAFVNAAGEPAEAIQRGLARAVETGMLLRLTVEGEGPRRELYFLNAPADRRGMEAVRTGTVDLGRVVAPSAPADAAPPGIFVLYESLIGTLGPGIADELTEAERLYPAEWLEAAFREAAAQNARSWRYVTRILERWAIEGRDNAATERDPAGDERYFSGKYGRILRQRLKS
jgi:DnaD/phage-associated family protein